MIKRINQRNKVDKKDYATVNSDGTIKFKNTGNSEATVTVTCLAQDGSKKSANTTHLAEILKNITTAIHIENENELENYNDLVEKSERYIKKIIPSSNFYFGDARKIRPNQKFDLIISNAMFQWFEGHFPLKI